MNKKFCQPEGYRITQDIFKMLPPDAEAVMLHEGIIEVFKKGQLVLANENGDVAPYDKIFREEDLLKKE
jgi:hypothetical protein